MNTILLPSDPVKTKTVHQMYAAELQSAKNHFDVSLFNLTSFEVNDDKYFHQLVKNQNKENILYHGWMMNLSTYDKLYYLLDDKYNYQLLNDLEQYKACHHFDGWYDCIKDHTPKSMIVPTDNLREMIDAVIAFQKENNCAVIIKDYVSSLKHYWNDACFIPANADPFHQAKVVGNFLNIKKNNHNFNGGLVIREFIDLKMIGEHPQSKMPIAHEYRSFVCRGNLVGDPIPYWEGVYDDIAVPPIDFLNHLKDQVYAHTKSNLFTIDCAMKANGEWICIEVGDGQVSSLPEQTDKDKFFSLIKGMI